MSPQNVPARPRAAITTALGLAALGLLVLLGATPASAQGPEVVERPGEIVYPELPEFDVPDPRREVLPNGLTVLLVENHELPLVQGTLLVRTGARFVPADHTGLAAVTGELLTSGGTAGMSPEELARTLEDRAAQLYSEIGTTSGQVVFDMLSEDFAELFPLVVDTLREPAFDPDQLEVVKTALAAEVARQNDDATGIAFRELTEIVYGDGSPYARNPTYATLAAISRDDVVDWYRRAFHPDGMILGLYGDFDADEALALVRRELGDWQAGAGLPLAPPPVTTKPSPGVFEVVKTDVNQSTITMGHLGITNDHPDYYAVQVLNEVLAGGDTSRLYQEIRNERGLAYAVSGQVGGRWDYPGTAAVFTITKAETTEEAIEALLAELAGLESRPPDDAEVAAAKDRILSSFVFNFDAPSEVLEQQLLLEYYDYPRDWVERYAERIEAVTTADVRRAAAEHLRPEELAIVVVGPRTGRDGDLSRFGTVTARDIAIEPPPAERAERTEEGASQARELLGRAVEAMGGATAVDGVETLAVETSGTQKTPMGELEVSSSVQYRFPGHLRQEIRLPMGTMTLVATPEGGSITSPMGSQPLPPSQLAEIAREMRRTPLAILQARDTPGVSAVATGTVEVDGVEAAAVQVEREGDLLDLAIDPASGRLLQVAYSSTGPDGAPARTVVAYSDYRPVAGGLVYPHASAVSQGGEPSGSSTVQSIEVNPELPAGTFDTGEAGAPVSGTDG